MKISNAQPATAPSLDLMSMPFDSPWAWSLLPFSVLRGLPVVMVFLLLDVFL